MGWDTKIQIMWLPEVQDFGDRRFDSVECAEAGSFRKVREHESQEPVLSELQQKRFMDSLEEL
ncbi:MAG: hypothetical protein ACI8X5_003045 [Planctomycetota bacterium]